MRSTWSTTTWSGAVRGLRPSPSNPRVAGRRRSTSRNPRPSRSACARSRWRTWLWITRYERPRRAGLVQRDHRGDALREARPGAWVPHAPARCVGGDRRALPVRRGLHQVRGGRARGEGARGAHRDVAADRVLRRARGRGGQAMSGEYEITQRNVDPEKGDLTRELAAA